MYFFIPPHWPTVWQPLVKIEWWGSTASLLALRFFDAIRLNDTNAFVINILRASGQPAAAMAKEGPSPPTTGSRPHPASDAAPSKQTAGSHLDGTCLYMHASWDPSAMESVEISECLFIFWRADTLPLRQYKWTLTTCISYLTTVIYLQVRNRGRNSVLRGG